MVKPSNRTTLYKKATAFGATAFGLSETNDSSYFVFEESFAGTDCGKAGKADGS